MKASALRQGHEEGGGAREKVFPDRSGYTSGGRVAAGHGALFSVKTPFPILSQFGLFLWPVIQLMTKISTG